MSKPTKVQADNKEVVLEPKCKTCSGYEEKIESKSESEVCKEIAEMEKHEILCQMTKFLGEDPSMLQKAEEMFDVLKYNIAEFVLKNEFNQEHDLSVQVTLWLEQKKQPNSYDCLNDFVHKYLK